MNILLANMPMTFNRRENLEPPLGICYIGGMLKTMKGAVVHLKDFEVADYSPESLRAYLAERSIDVVGVSFRTASYGSAKRFVTDVKSFRRDIFVAAGGHHATAFPRETLADMRCDAVIVGEGEYAFKDVIGRLQERASLAGVPGVVFRDADNRVIANPPRQPIENIDDLPWPSRELLDLGSYNVMTLLTSRGCPFDCIYCDKGVSTRAVKYRSADGIFEEIRYLVSTLHKNRLYVVDDHFFLNKKKLREVLDRIIREKLPVQWTCQARVDGITADILAAAREAGCEQIMFGIETGDESELKYIRKSSTLKQAEEAVRLTKKAGIRARANFMLGFPVSTKETVKNTIRFARRIKPDIVRFFAVSPLPNTDLWDDIYGKGVIPPWVKWEELDFFKPSFNIKDLPREELSLYVTAGYWHVLKNDFLLEATLFFIPKLLRLLYLTARTGRLRGNISKCFPRSVNLIVDNMHQLSGKSFKEAVSFIRQVLRLERTF
ncbi:MAG: radical SAM protein [Candidatus Omnitrophica bacterium]|nr:radical SAM protein [Candidatus Omnitrophota bacterium]